MTDIDTAAVALRDTFVMAHGLTGLLSLRNAVNGISEADVSAVVPRTKSYSKRQRTVREEQRQRLKRWFMEHQQREFHVSAFEDWYDERKHLSTDLSALVTDQVIERGSRKGYWRLHERLRCHIDE